MTTSPLGPGSVLVVDDDHGIRELVGFALRRAGFDVIEASNGQAALDIVATAPVAMVVLDMGMSEMSGTYVVQALRARPETATLPVLLMTGSGDDMSVIEGLAAGADDFLLKP
ncbi:MAG TPA: response regulator, partial [Candidatus Dormibacteraeota bacterium]